MTVLENFERMLADGKDSPILRFSLGNEYLKAGRPEQAAAHFACAVEQDPEYSAAWKAYGKALTEAGRLQEALDVYRKGIEVAQGKGDIQAAKEMTVFARRIQKQLSEN
jgi:Tfp pilus assembly protein PilF